MRSSHYAAECRLKASGGVLDRWSLCIRSMSDMVNRYRNAMPALRFPPDSDRRTDMVRGPKSAQERTSWLSANASASVCCASCFARNILLVVI